MHRPTKYNQQEEEDEAWGSKQLEQQDEEGVVRLVPILGRI